MKKIVLCAGILSLLIVTLAIPVLSAGKNTDVDTPLNGELSKTVVETIHEVADWIDKTACGTGSAAAIEEALLMAARGEMSTTQLKDQFETIQRKAEGEALILNINNRK